MRGRAQLIDNGTTSLGDEAEGRGIEDRPTDPNGSQSQAGPRGDLSGSAWPDLITLAPVAAASASLAACGGGGSSNQGSVAPGAGTSPPAIPVGSAPSTDKQAARFLLHASLGASHGEISALRQEGYEAWLDHQMDLPIILTAKSFYAQHGFDRADENAYYDRAHTADNMIWHQLMTGGNGVRKRIALALSEFFVVSISNVRIRWPALAIGEYWDILNRHAFGNFRDLIEEISLNPTTGVFLDTVGNQKSDPLTGREPDENYGREVMQLFSIGLVELEIDGSTRLFGGQPKETYSADDVIGLAKCFTGYQFDYSGLTDLPHPANPTWPIEHPDSVRRPLTADHSRWRSPGASSLHSDDAKSFLGTTIPAGTDAPTTLKIALDTLFEHPNVGPFFARQMIQRLVTSNPTSGYVERVAKTFNNDGSGKRGNLRAVFKAILLDDEAKLDTTLEDIRFGKLREPVLRLAQWGRTFGAESLSGKWEMDDLSREHDLLGQSPLRPPSVFGFFRPQFVPAGAKAGQQNMTVPEFQIVNETSVVGYVNFMQDMIEARSHSSRDVRANYKKQLEIAHDTNRLVDHLDLLLTASQMSNATRSVIINALNSHVVTEASSDSDKLSRIHAAVLLTMASTDYLIQR